MTESTTETANGGLLASLGINGAQFGFQLFNFCLAAVIIWYLILKPLTAKMTERQKLIDDSLDNVKKVEENLRRSEQKYQERVDEAKVEANKIAERASESAAAAVTVMKQKAQTEIEGLVVKAKNQIALEREQTLGELKTQTAEVIISALEKIIKEKINDQKDQAIIEEMVKKMR